MYWIPAQYAQVATLCMECTVLLGAGRGLGLDELVLMVALRTMHGLLKDRLGLIEFELGLEVIQAREITAI